MLPKIVVWVVIESMTLWWHWLNSLVIRDLLRNRWRSLLTLLGIALGVAIWVAIQLANQSVLVQFEASLSQVMGQANLVVTPRSQPDMSEKDLDVLKPLWKQHTQWTPILDQTALLPTEPFEAVRVLGVDWFSDLAFRNRKTMPTEEGLEAQPNDFMSLFTPWNVLVGAKLAKDYQLSVGQSFPVLANDQTLNFNVIGILPSDGLGGAYNGRVIMMDIGLAQQVFQVPGRVSRVDILAPTVELDAIEANLQQTLPNALKVQRPKQRNAQSAKMLRAFQVNLTALSFISLLVGAFLIYNTMTISVVRRRPDIGTLRTLGWQRWHIATLFGSESLLLGLLGALLGLGLGVGFAQLSLKACRQPLKSFIQGSQSPNLSGCLTYSC